MKGNTVPHSVPCPGLGIIVAAGLIRLPDLPARVEGAGESIGRKPATFAMLSICGNLIDEAVVDWTGVVVMALCPLEV